MLKVGEVKEIYEMKGAGRSVRGIAGELGIARNTVRRYLRSPAAIRAKPRPQRASKLDPYTGYIDHRLDEGLENCVVLHRELTARGYDSGEELPASNLRAMTSRTVLQGSQPQLALCLESRTARISKWAFSLPWAYPSA